MGWIDSSCALCGARGAEAVFDVPDDAAPHGHATVVRCHHCGLRRLDPRPDAESVKDYYGRSYYTSRGRTRPAAKQLAWDMIRDLSRRSAHPTLRGHLVAGLASALARRIFDVNPPHLPASSRVIEIGSGFGDLLIYLQARGCDVLGVDIDPVASGMGRRYGVHIMTADVRQLHLERSSYDLAIMNHSLEHVDDPLAVLRCVAELLRPNGALHVAVPNGAAAAMEQQGHQWGALCYPVHFWYFDSFTLSSILAQAGLVVTWANSADILRNQARFWWRTLREKPTAVSELLVTMGQRLQIPLSGDVLRVVARPVPE